MNKVNNIIKENYDLKNELDSIIARLKENDTKHQGFKMIQFSVLLSNTIEEISEKSLYYIEEIFDVDKTMLFIRENTYEIMDYNNKDIKRIKVVDKKSIKYTFLQPDIKVCNQYSTVHSHFQLIPENEECSYILCPVLVDKEIVAVIGLYSKDKNKFTEDHEFDFIKELAIIVSVGLKKINDSYLLSLKSMKDSLTGLYNSYYLEKINEEYFNDYKTKKEAYTIMLLSLPSYNTINIQLGKQKGNEYIKKLSSKLGKNIKNNNTIIGRYSEYEFYVILKGTDSDVESLKEIVIKTVNDIFQKIKYNNSYVLTIINNNGINYKLKTTNKSANHSDILNILNKISEEEKNKVFYNGTYSEEYYNKENSILNKTNEILKDYNNSIENIKDKDSFIELKKMIVEQWLENVKNENSSVVEYEPFL